MAPEEDRNRLIESGLGMVRAIAAEIVRKVPPWVELDDLIQVGHVALCTASDRYSQQRGVAFATYAKFRVRGAILDHLRDQCRHNAEVPLEGDQEGDGDEDAIHQGDAIHHHQGAEAAIHQGAEAGELRRAIAQLPRAQRRVMQLSLEGYTYAEIADRTGTTFGAVYRANGRALKRLRKILDDAA